MQGENSVSPAFSALGPRKGAQVANATCNKCGLVGSWQKNSRGGWYLRHACEARRSGGNERHSSLSDYAHWNEEAAIVKAMEDRYTDYYAD